MSGRRESGRALEHLADFHSAELQELADRLDSAASAAQYRLPRQHVTGRRKLRKEIQRTWVVYEPVGKPGPFTQQGMVDADFATGEPLPMPKTYRVERIDGSKLTRPTR